jgi:glutathione S-transferase
MMRLLGRPDSLNVRKVLWALEELGCHTLARMSAGCLGETMRPNTERSTRMA